jgi:hypothetical protein
MRTSDALDEEMEAMEARVRWKNEMRLPLTAEEAAFFARMPADKRNARERKAVEMRGGGAVPGAAPPDT